MYCNRLHAWWSTYSRLATLLSSLSPPVKYFTDRFKAVLLLWIFYVLVLSCVCYVFVHVCLYVFCGYLLGFMLIVGVPQSCRSGNHARFILEHIFITNQQKTSLYSTFLGSENFKWTIWNFAHGWMVIIHCCIILHQVKVEKTTVLPAKSDSDVMFVYIVIRDL